MIKALIVSSGKTSFLDMESVFADNNVETLWAGSGNRALKIVVCWPFDLIIVDEVLSDMTGLHLAKKLISRNPMLNMAVVSSLSSRNFHEASEGLGILMRLPPIPEKSDAEKLLEHLQHILDLTRKRKLN